MHLTPNLRTALRRYFATHTVAATARLLKCRPSTIYRWRTGKSVYVTDDLWGRLAAELGVDPQTMAPLVPPPPEATGLPAEVARRFAALPAAAQITLIEALRKLEQEGEQ